MKTFLRVYSIPAAVAVALVFSACSGERVGDVGAYAVYSICDRGHRVYATERGLAVVPNEPTCSSSRMVSR